MARVTGKRYEQDAEDVALAGASASADASDLSGMNISEIRARIAGAPPEPGDLFWCSMERDPRAGVRGLLDRLISSRKREAREHRRLEGLRRHERALWEKGVELVAGVDEAGRGPLAGPVFAAAVVLPRDCVITGLNDSKKLSPRRREELFEVIYGEAVAVGVGSATHAVIDEINILKATMSAMADAVRGLGIDPDHVLVDGAQEIPGVPWAQTAVHQGDQKSAPIAAASIVAKVTRDRLMLEMDKLYSGYGFARHKGYGTEDHIAALTRLGPCPIHRMSFHIVQESSSGPSPLYRRLRSALMDAPDIETLELAAKGVAMQKAELAPYELGKLRKLYKRCYVRLASGLGFSR
ncbi:ribonuclease HII [bacterium]|nr:ribonuclease HII [bacterium]